MATDDESWARLRAAAHELCSAMDLDDVMRWSRIGHNFILGTHRDIARYAALGLCSPPKGEDDGAAAPRWLGFLSPLGQAVTRVRWTTIFPHGDGLRASGPILGTFLWAWEAAMGSCFHFELSARLLAQVRFARESIELDLGARAGLLALLFRHWPFTDDEKDFLPKCNTMRNKIIHCEPDTLYKIVREIDPSFTPPPHVRSVTLDEHASGSEILDAITTQRGVVDVKNTTTRDQGFSGWMMEAASNGTFAKAVEILGRGIAILRSKAEAAVEG